MDEWRGEAPYWFPFLAFEGSILFLWARQKVPVRGLVSFQMFVIIMLLLMFVVFRNLRAFPVALGVVACTILIGWLVARIRGPEPLAALPIVPAPAKLTDARVRVERHLARPPRWAALQVSVHVDVDGTPAEIFPLVADAQRWGQVTAMQTFTEQTSPGPWGVGAEYRMDFAYGRVLYAMLGTITRYEAPSAMTAVCSGPGATVSEGAFRLDGNGQQVTRLTQSCRIWPESVFQRVWMLVTWPMQYAFMWVVMRQDLSARKRLIEESLANSLGV